jgi:hypothetical protein
MDTACLNSSSPGGWIHGHAHSCSTMSEIVDGGSIQPRVAAGEQCAQSG